LSRPVTGRLTESLVERQHLAVQLSVNYTGLQAGPGRFQLMIAPSQKVSLTKLEKTLAEELEKLVRDGVTAEEIENTKDYILAELVYTQDDIIKASQTLASLYASGMPIQEIESWPDAIKAVTPEEINQVLREVFAHPQPVVGRLVPKNSKKSGRDTK